MIASTNACVADACHEFAGRLQPSLRRLRGLGRGTVVEKGFPVEAHRIVELAELDQQRIRPGLARIQVEMNDLLLASSQDSLDPFANLALLGIIGLGAVTAL